MPPERTPQRIRQACEPCRRKKSKCPGQRPACSFCARLGQVCIYRDQNEKPQAFQSPVPDNTGNPARLEALESKLDAVLQAVGLQNGNQHQPSSQRASVVPASVPSTEEWEKSGISLPSWGSIQEAGVLYLRNCECQPLPLFPPETLLGNIHSRKPEVLFAILALTARFSDRDPASAVEVSNAYAEEARRLVTRHVFKGSIRLSTLQSLCLLSVVDFTNGNTHRASLTNCMAMNLAHSAGLTPLNRTVTESALTGEEKRRCFWSIRLCRTLHGTNFSSPDFPTDSDLSWLYPKSSGQPPLPSAINILKPNIPLLDPSQSPEDSGILAYMIQISDVWFKTTQYAARRGTPSIIPPWSSKSQYTKITSQHMELETKLPYEHRFKLSRFQDRSSEDLNSNRTYWGPWLFIQFLYHTNMCLLNHPLLLSLRLRNFRRIIPEVFLQQTADLISTHATWVLRFIELVESKDYKVSDPFLGHCVAIVATIHLQHAYTLADPAKREEKQSNFTKCLKFVQVMGQQWPNMARIAEKLQTLETIVSMTNLVSGQGPQIPTRGMLIDLGRFWEILDYCASSAKPNTQQNLISPELFTSPDDPADGVSLTSPLPDTFRLDDYNHESRASANGPAAEDSGMEHHRQNPQLFPEPSMGNNWGLGGTAFSEDELAVLADEFFDVGNHAGGFDAEAGLWGFGNL